MKPSVSVNIATLSLFITVAHVIRISEKYFSVDLNIYFSSLTKRNCNPSLQQSKTSFFLFEQTIFYKLISRVN